MPMKSSIPITRLMQQMTTILLLLLPFTTTAQIYKWTDANGETHFSDKAPDHAPGAEKITIPPANTIATPIREKAPAQPSSRPLAKRYETLTITSPTNDQAIRANAGNIQISCQLQPPLKTKRKHQIQFKLDGRITPHSGTHCTLSLSNISRGTHTVSAEVIDADGTSLIQSPLIRFHLLRHNQN